MKYILLIVIICLPGTQLFGQKTIFEKELLQMADSVNYLLRNSDDGFVQPFFSINTKGDITILDSQQSGFRFNLFSLQMPDSTNDFEKGIVFVPENSKSITTNKFILFKDKNGKTVGLFKFTRTGDAYVQKIYELLLRIRSYIGTAK